MGLNSALRNPGPQWLPLRNQQGFELFYNAEITRWFHLTFDMQAMEAATPDTATSLLFGIRGRIVF
jgi:porin